MFTRCSWDLVSIRNLKTSVYDCVYSVSSKLLLCELLVITTTYSSFGKKFSQLFFPIIFYLQLELVTTLIFGWSEEGTIWRVKWRCATRESGGQCVMTPGISEMQWLSVDSLVSPQNVIFVRFSVKLLKTFLCVVVTTILDPVFQRFFSCSVYKATDL